MLELIAMSKRYGDVVPLDGLSMTVGAGRIHGFVGRNGAGKTTAMRITVGLARPDAGEVRWKGRPGLRRRGDAPPGPAEGPPGVPGPRNLRSACVVGTGG